MKRFPRTLLALVLWGVAAAPAMAHSPYFTRLKSVTLPDGQPAQMRVINSAGVFFADPTRVIIVDHQRRLLARTPKSRLPMTLRCEADGKACWGFDHATGQVLVPDPATFRRDGPMVPAGGDRLRPIADGDEGWGFTAQEPTTAQYVAAEWSMARRMPMPIIGEAVLGGLGLLAFASLRSPRNWQSRRLGLWFTGALLRLAGVVMVPALALNLGVLFGLSLPLLLASLAAGGALAIVAWALRGWRGAHVAVF